MYSKYFRLLCVGAILLMAIMACNIGAPAAGATATPAELTEIGKNVPTATDTEPPTETATPEPSITPTETLTLEPSITPTVGLPVASVIKELNCRTGPSGAYELVRKFQVGDVVEIMARDLGGGFVFVLNPSEPDQGCWVLENGLNVSGDDITPLPAFTPLPSPTVPPSFTVKFKEVDNCHGRTFARFEVVNTGPIQFRSAYIKATNQRNKEVAEQSVNAFDLNKGCLIQFNISPLTPGKTGYLETAVFYKASIKGQKIIAAFQLCVEQFLKGACVTQSLAFTAN